MQPAPKRPAPGRPAQARSKVVQPALGQTARVQLKVVRPALERLAQARLTPAQPAALQPAVTLPVAAPWVARVNEERLTSLIRRRLLISRSLRCCHASGGAPGKTFHKFHRRRARASLGGEDFFHVRKCPRDVHMTNNSVHGALKKNFLQRVARTFTSTVPLVQENPIKFALSALKAATIFTATETDVGLRVGRAKLTFKMDEGAGPGNARRSSTPASSYRRMRSHG
jgi:hypothetical protein